MEPLAIFPNNNQKPNISRNKPKRPLSAYNIFFKHTRSRIVEGLPLDADIDEETLRCIEANVAASSSSSEHKDDKKDRNKKKKPFGQISFGNLARTIANRWEATGGYHKAIYENHAMLDRMRYRTEVAFRKVLNEGESVDAQIKPIAYLYASSSANGGPPHHNDNNSNNCNVEHQLPRPPFLQMNKTNNGIGTQQACNEGNSINGNNNNNNRTFDDKNWPTSLQIPFPRQQPPFNGTGFRPNTNNTNCNSVTTPTHCSPHHPPGFGRSDDDNNNSNSNNNTVLPPFPPNTGFRPNNGRTNQNTNTNENNKVNFNNEFVVTISENDHSHHSTLSFPSTQQQQQQQQQHECRPRKRRHNTDNSFDSRKISDISNSVIKMMLASRKEFETFIPNHLNWKYPNVFRNDGRDSSNNSNSSSKSSSKSNSSSYKPRFEENQHLYSAIRVLEKELVTIHDDLYETRKKIVKVNRENFSRRSVAPGHEGLDPNRILHLYLQKLAHAGVSSLGEGQPRRAQNDSNRTDPNNNNNKFGGIDFDDPSLLRKKSRIMQLFEIDEEDELKCTGRRSCEGRSSLTS